jgi:hypothetical protein
VVETSVEPVIGRPILEHMFDKGKMPNGPAARPAGAARRLGRSLRSPCVCLPRLADD